LLSLPQSVAFFQAVDRVAEGDRMGLMDAAIGLVRFGGLPKVA
jgi:hypothetical protein